VRGKLGIAAGTPKAREFPEVFTQPASARIEPTPARPFPEVDDIVVIDEDQYREPTRRAERKIPVWLLSTLLATGSVLALSAIGIGAGLYTGVIKYDFNRASGPISTVVESDLNGPATANVQIPDTKAPLPDVSDKPAGNIPGYGDNTGASVAENGLVTDDSMTAALEQGGTMRVVRAGSKTPADTCIDDHMRNFIRKLYSTPGGRNPTGMPLLFFGPDFISSREVCEEEKGVKASLYKAPFEGGLYRIHGIDDFELITRNVEIEQAKPAFPDLPSGLDDAYYPLELLQEEEAPAPTGVTEVTPEPSQEEEDEAPVITSTDDTTGEGIRNKKVRTVTVRPDGTIVNADEVFNKTAAPDMSRLPDLPAPSEIPASSVEEPGDIQPVINPAIKAPVPRYRPIELGGTGAPTGQKPVDLMGGPSF